MEDKYICVGCDSTFTLMELSYLGPPIATEECTPFMEIVAICHDCYEAMEIDEPPA